MVAIVSDSTVHCVEGILGQSVESKLYTSPVVSRFTLTEMMHSAMVIALPSNSLRLLCLVACISSPLPLIVSDMDRIPSDVDEEDGIDSGFVSMAAQEQPPAPSPAAAASSDGVAVASSTNEGDAAAAVASPSPLSSDDTSSPLYQSDPWSYADNYESLDLSFDDIADLGSANMSGSSHVAGTAAGASSSSASGGYASAAAASSASYDLNNEELYPSCKKGDPFGGGGGEESAEDAYILGTLIVRVVAARNLSAADSSGFAQAVGGILFGSRMAGGAGGGVVSGGSRGGSGGSVNPYASVRFGATTQRTSQVFGTPDPIWPRAEAMYLDVTHPPPEAAGAVSSASPRSSGSAETRKSVPGGKMDRARSDSSAARPSPVAESKTAVDSWSDVDPPVLTVGIFHSNADMSLKKQKYSHGDSNDVFLGMATVNLTHLLTGKCRFDEWLPLQGGPSSAGPRSSVRLVCEYEPSDPPPHKGDVVQFTRFCRPCDLYPLTPFGTTYTVEEGCNDSDLVLIQSTSREGWYVPLCERGAESLHPWQAILTLHLLDLLFSGYRHFWCIGSCCWSWSVISARWICTKRRCCRSLSDCRTRQC
jgi:C2 domain